jgi:hypothetical protein
VKHEFKDFISASEIVGLVQRLRRPSLPCVLPIDIRTATVLQFEGQKRQINTIIQNTDGRNWTISIHKFDYTKDHLYSVQNKPGRKPVIARSTGSTVHYFIYGDFERFAKDMTLCKTFGYLEEVRT